MSPGFEWELRVMFVRAAALLSAFVWGANLQVRPEKGLLSVSTGRPDLLIDLSHRRRLCPEWCLDCWTEENWHGYNVMLCKACQKVQIRNVKNTRVGIYIYIYMRVRNLPQETYARLSFWERWDECSVFDKNQISAVWERSMLPYFPANVCVETFRVDVILEI